MKVTVLLSSYNGEKYIKEQIDSILEQDIKEFAELKILVRDDGSNDKTQSILDEYQQKGLLTWYTGQNLRPARSFWHLLSNCEDSDYYAFCDQDDFWKKDKLSRAVKLLQENQSDNKPLLYCSAVTVVDAELKEFGVMDCSDSRPDPFAYSLVYSMVPGCTFVFNHSAKLEMKKYDIENNFVIIHDWLATKIVAMKGEVIYDEFQSLLYRQHGNNVIGCSKRGIGAFLQKVKKFLNGKSDSTRSEVAKSLLKVYGDELDKDSKEYYYLNIVANYKNDKKLKKAFLREKVFYTNKKNNFFLKALIRMKKV